jgi:hypothetical protein
MAQDTLQKGKAAAAQTARKVEEGLSASTENLRDLNVTLIEMAHANIESVFEFARQAATAKTPSDIVNLWSAHIPKQVQLLSAQMRELTELGQKLASRSAPSITPDG